MNVELHFGGTESMVMKFHGNVRDEVQVNFLALFASKPHIFMCSALKLSRIVRANVRLNIAIPIIFLSLALNPTKVLRTAMHDPQPRLPSSNLWLQGPHALCQIEMKTPVGRIFYRRTWRHATLQSVMLIWVSSHSAQGCLINEPKSSGVSKGGFW